MQHGEALLGCPVLPTEGPQRTDHPTSRLLCTQDAFG